MLPRAKGCSHARSADKTKLIAIHAARAARLSNRLGDLSDFVAQQRGALWILLRWILVRAGLVAVVTASFGTLIGCVLWFIAFGAVRLLQSASTDRSTIDI
jgi:hypothetical protein